MRGAHRGARRRRQGVGQFRSGSGAGPGPRARQRNAAWPAAWRADRAQRHDRYVRHADRDGLAGLSRQPAARRRILRRAAAPRRRRDPRQDRNLRIRRQRAAIDHQPAQSRVYARRFVERLGGRGCRSHGGGRARHPDRRFGAAAVLVLRNFRLQADLQHVQQSRRLAGRRTRSTRSAGWRARSTTSRC